MREILFSGRRIDNGEWVEGFYYEDIAGKSVILSRPSDFVYVDPFDVDPESVRQFSGLRDHTEWEELCQVEQEVWLKKYKPEDWNGKRIFEGDIVSIKHPVFDEFETEREAIVCYGLHSQSMVEEQETSLGFYMDFGRDSWLRKDVGYWIKHYIVKVIGNVFDCNQEVTENGV